MLVPSCEDWKANLTVEERIVRQECCSAAASHDEVDEKVRRCSAVLSCM